MGTGNRLRQAKAGSSEIMWVLSSLGLSSPRRHGRDGFLGAVCMLTGVVVNEDGDD